jgi:tetratricopeptide (TPR) repeat protein
MLESQFFAGATLEGRYRLVRRIGHGGMGTVYEAVDSRLGSTVALKWMCPAPDAGELQMQALLRAFEREAKILARLRHPALPGVSDYFGDAEGQCLVMQYIPGSDLAELLACRGEAFPVEQVLSWADELLDALEYLHGRRPPVLHRDIKPQNLKLTPSGAIVLLDFGLARGGEGQGQGVGASLLAYTPQYAPIEQIRGEPPDPRSDLYALGATLYHLLTGQLPANAVARMQALLQREPDPLIPAHTLNPAVPEAVGAALQRAMAPLPEDRPPGAAALRALLHDAGQVRSERREPADTLTAKRPFLHEAIRLGSARASRMVRLWPLPRFFGGLALAAAALAGALLAGQVARPEPAEGGAEQVRAVSSATLGTAQLRPTSVTPRASAAPGLVQQGRALAAAGQEAQALVVLNQAVRQQPESAAAYLARGDAYARAGEPERALEDYGLALALEPQNPAVFLSRGLVSFALREYERAIGDFDRHLALAPDSAPGYYNRALAHTARGDHQSALADYNRYLALRPLDADGFVARGRVYVAIGEMRRALDDFDRALELRPDLGEALMERASARLRAGQRQGAESDLRAAARLGTDEELRRRAAELLAGLD